VAASGGKKVHFSQTDPGGAQHGTMVKTAAACTTADLRKEYGFTLSGTSIPMQPGESAGTIAAKGLIKADDSGNFKLALGASWAAMTDVTITVDAECIVDMEIVVPGGDAKSATPMKLRGVLTDAGKEILAIQTDPGAMVSGTFTAH
jgi:hypothetical protein